MAAWDDVRRIVLALPETTEQAGGNGMLGWRVRNKPLAWERPLRRSDLEAGRVVVKSPVRHAPSPTGQPGQAAVVCTVPGGSTSSAS